MLKYKVIKLKKDERFSTGFGSDLVKAGSRILICDMGTDMCGVCSWQELTADEVEEEREQNECFYYDRTVYTEKGNKVDIYYDEETLECFFNVTKVQGAN